MCNVGNEGLTLIITCKSLFSSYKSFSSFVFMGIGEEGTAYGGNEYYNLGLQPKILSPFSTKFPALSVLLGEK